MVFTENWQVILSSKTISTFIRPTVWKRWNCHCVGSFPIEMSGCIKRNVQLGDLGHRYGSQTSSFCSEAHKGTTLPKERICCLGSPWPPTKCSQPLTQIFSHTHCDKKGSQIQRIIYWWINPLCSPGKHPTVPTQAASLLAPQTPIQYPKNIDLSYNSCSVL